MSVSTFKIANSFFISTKSTFVISGNITRGEIAAEMFLASEENDIRLKINSIEAIRSNDTEESIGLTFVYKEINEIEPLKKLKRGDSVLIII